MEDSHDDDMFIEEIVRTYGNDPDFKDDLEGFIGDGVRTADYRGRADEAPSLSSDEQVRDAIIASQILAQRERRQYFNKFILPFTNWGQASVQTSYGGLPGDPISYAVTRDSQICSENIFNTYRPTEAVACYAGCIHQCVCHDYDSV